MTQYKTYQKSLIPFAIQVSGGSIPGWSSVNKFGRNPAGAADTEELVWDGSVGTYEWPTSACTLAIQSTNASDAAAGAGARTVLVTGQNASRIEITETVTLNGTTTVNSACNYARVYRMQVTQSGSTGKNEGIISACGNGFGLAYISASYNQTLMAIYSVPDNKEAFLTHWYGGVNISQKVGSEREADLKLYIRGASSTNSFQIKHFQGVNSTGTGNFQHVFDIPVLIGAGSDMYISACCQDANTDVSAGFDLFLKDTV